MRALMSVKIIELFAKMSYGKYFLSKPEFQRVIIFIADKIIKPEVAPVTKRERIGLRFCVSSNPKLSSESPSPNQSQVSVKV